MKKSLLCTIQAGISVNYNRLIAQADTLMHELKMRKSEFWRKLLSSLQKVYNNSRICSKAEAYRFNHKLEDLL